MNSTWISACSLVLSLSGYLFLGSTVQADTSWVRPQDLQHRSIALTLVDTSWEGWLNLCPDLVQLLELDQIRNQTGGSAVVSDSERLLLSTGYFQAAHCVLTSTTTKNPGFSCSLKPNPILFNVAVDGDIPFVLLKEDILSQMSFHPGQILGDSKTRALQARRVENYLTTQGFFNSKVTMNPQSLAYGAEPNQAIRLSTTVAVGEDATLRNVDIATRGSTPLPQAGISFDDIQAQFKHYWVFSIFPRRFTPEQFDSDVDFITQKYKKHGYPQVNIEHHYRLIPSNSVVDAELKIQLGPRLILQFLGNRSVSTSDLAEQATFVDAGTIDAFEVENTRSRIVTKYQEEGFYLADVRATMSSTTNSTASLSQVEITFEIQEGPRGEITAVTIQGNDALSSSQIFAGAHLSTHPSKFLSTGRWVNRIVQHDLQLIVQFYRQQGFARASVSALYQVIAPGQLAVRFQVQEGPRQMVSEVTFAGIPADIPISELQRSIQLVEHAPFMDARLALDRRSMLTLLAAHGYPRAHVARKMRMPFPSDAGNVLIHYFIDSGPKSMLGGIFLRGNFRTSGQFIRDEMRLQPGASLDLVQVELARQRLFKLGVFRSVQLEPLGTWRPSASTWLLASLEEMDQRTIDAVVAFRTDEYFSVGADAHDNNFMGRAIRLDLKARLSNADQIGTHDRIGLADRLSGSLSAPEPLGLPVTVTYTGEYDYEDKPAYRLRAISASIVAYKPILTRSACPDCPNVTVSLIYRLSSSNFHIIDLTQLSAQNDPIRIEQLNSEGNQTIGRIGPKVIVEHLDSTTDPQRGYSGSASLEWAHPVLAGPLSSASPFWRVLSSADVFLTCGILGANDLGSSIHLGGPVVFALGAKYDQARPIRSGQPVPLSETFAYGGDLDVRGIADKASLVVFPDANYLLTASLELRYYFLRLAWGAFQIAALSDTGLASSYQLNQLFQAPTVTVGGAFRFVTPIGPVSLAYARPIIQPALLDAPTAGRIHLSFGYTF